MKLMIGNLQAFAQQVHSGLDNADWPTRRQIITILVKRVEIEPSQVTIVYRVDIDPFDPSPTRGILHYRSARQSAPNCTRASRRRKTNPPLPDRVKSRRGSVASKRGFPIEGWAPCPVPGKELSP